MWDFEYFWQDEVGVDGHKDHHATTLCKAISIDVVEVALILDIEVGFADMVELFCKVEGDGRGVFGIGG